MILQVSGLDLGRVRASGPGAILWALGLLLGGLGGLGFGFIGFRRFRALGFGFIGSGV